MDKHITLLVTSNTAPGVIQKTFSKTAVVWFCLSAAAILVFISFMVYDYCLLKKDALYSNGLSTRITAQQGTIKSQRGQIEALAGEINELKSQLVCLNSFESRIRVITDIEQNSDQGNIFGVGGSIPEDLDPKIMIKEGHDSLLLREMHQQMEVLQMASIDQEKRFTTLLKYLEEQKNILACTPAICPTDGSITSRFGYRKSPFTGKREFHKGLDISNPGGTKIIATADGIISFAGTKGALGKVIVIDHGHGLVTRYAHTSKLLKKAGDKVKRGDKIAETGKTGRTTGSHLHYEVRVNGVAVDPQKYILN